MPSVYREAGILNVIRNGALLPVLAPSRLGKNLQRQGVLRMQIRKRGLPAIVAEKLTGSPEQYESKSNWGGF